MGKHMRIHQISSTSVSLVPEYASILSNNLFLEVRLRK
jgi:hypothetical protein